MARRSFDIGGRIAPPRFIAFMVVFAVAMPLLAPSLGTAGGTMTAFDIAGGTFMALIAPMFLSDSRSVRNQARRNDANRSLLLVISVVVSLVVLVSVISEMRAKSNHLAVALVVGTLGMTWLFSNTVYAMHYAHLYYLADTKGTDNGGIEFPGETEPDYWDFAYFSFTLGMTFQTSDVDVSSRRIRRVMLGHCMAAFVFNIGVLALTINVLGSS